MRFILVIFCLFSVLVWGDETHYFGIGVDTYKDPQMPKTYGAKLDAERVKNFLQSEAGGGVPEESCYLLKDEKATKKGILNLFKKHSKRIKKCDTLFIFMTLHGGTSNGLFDDDPEKRFYPYDTDDFDIEKTTFTMREFACWIFKYIKARRVIVFIQSCYSGACVEIIAAKNKRYKKEIIAFSSSRSDETSLISNYGGIFGIALIAGLKGDADINGDQLVTAEEIAEFVKDKVRAISGSHTPEVYIHKKMRDYIMADNREIEEEEEEEETDEEEDEE